MTAASTVPSVDDVQKFHGHMCLGLALGYRVAIEGLAELGVARSEDEELVAVVENDSCAVDAIQVVLGCTFGKGNLVFRDWGRRVYTFYSRHRETGVRVSEHYNGFADDPEWAALRERAAAGDESPETREALATRTEAHIRAILNGPRDAVLTVSSVPFDPPAMAQIESSEPCEACGEPTMASRLVEHGGRRICRACVPAGG
ncbi:MAG TPA: FmdE family protein [Armatimonadota bacterium]|nr:FmdE family protein [Armatimonadota bacterium]HQK93125.1 FmdE family protein [Armatimonadota bacterium]